MGPPALIPDPEGSRLVCWNGEFTKYREVNMFVIDTIQARLEELETFKLMMESRTMLKVFSKGMVELRPSTISPCLRLIVPKATRSYKDYTKTRTFVEILRPYNAFAHSVWLQTDYQQLQSSRILRCLEDDILSINPDHKKVFKQLSRSDKISVLLGFPEQRIKRAIESENETYPPLQQYHALRMKHTDKPLLIQLGDFRDYKSLEALSNLQVTPTKTGDEIIKVALTFIDDAKPSEDREKIKSELEMFMELLDSFAETSKPAVAAAKPRGNGLLPKQQSLLRTTRRFSTVKNSFPRRMMTTCLGFLMSTRKPRGTRLPLERYSRSY